MEERPSRAKARISSIASQGFFSRLRRSALCALVSFGAASSAMIAPLGAVGRMSGKTKNPRQRGAEARAYGVRLYGALPRRPAQRATTRAARNRHGTENHSLMIGEIR